MDLSTSHFLNIMESKLVSLVAKKKDSLYLLLKTKIFLFYMGYVIRMNIFFVSLSPHLSLSLPLSLSLSFVSDCKYFFVWD